MFFTHHGDLIVGSCPDFDSQFLDTQGFQGGIHGTRETCVLLAKIIVLVRVAEGIEFIVNGEKGGNDIGSFRKGVAVFHGLSEREKRTAGEFWVFCQAI